MLFHHIAILLVFIGILRPIRAYNWTDANCATSLAPFNHSLAKQSADSFVEIVTAYNYTTYVIYTNPAQPFSYRITDDNRSTNTAYSAYTLDGCAHGTINIASMQPLPLHLAVRCDATNNITCKYSFSYKAQFVCFPNCTNKYCGSDGCSGTCGTCGSGLYCSDRFACIIDSESPVNTQSKTSINHPEESFSKSQTTNPVGSNKTNGSAISTSANAVIGGVVGGVAFALVVVAGVWMKFYRHGTGSPDVELNGRKDPNTSSGTGSWGSNQY